jgi:hypothetical protein
MCQQAAIIAPHRHVQFFRRGVDQEDIDRVQPSPRERHPLRGGVRIPEIPDVRFRTHP